MTLFRPRRFQHLVCTTAPSCSALSVICPGLSDPAALPRQYPVPSRSRAASAAQRANLIVQVLNPHTVYAFALYRAASLSHALLRALPAFGAQQQAPLAKVHRVGASLEHTAFALCLILYRYLNILSNHHLSSPLAPLLPRASNSCPTLLSLWCNAGP